jgi:hypothetical protein
MKKRPKTTRKAAKKKHLSYGKKDTSSNNSECNLNIRGKRYRFQRTGIVGNDCWGYCTDPSEGNRLIKVHNQLKNEKELEFIIHEMVHACFWDLDEAVVKEVGKDLSKALWKMGYRKQS